MAWPYLATFRFGVDDPFITAYARPDAPVDVIWDVYRRTVLPMALQVLGWEALHASAIVATVKGASQPGIVAFSAVSETGKSTVAYALRRRGFPQWSDDGVVFRVEEHASALPLPFAARLRPESCTMFGVDPAAFAHVEENGAGEQQYVEPLPITAICVLTRTAEGPSERIRAMEPAEAFPALLIHAHEFDPANAERRARMMKTYLDLVAHVPVYEVAFLPDRNRMSHLLDVIVDALGLRLPAAVQRGCA
jgi:hypothetical protein